MDKWTTLEPVKLHGPPTIPTSKTAAPKTHYGASYAHQNRAQFIGRIPSELHLLILHFLAISDIPAYARTNKAISRLAGDERLWEKRWNILIGNDNSKEGKLKAEEKARSVLEELERRRGGRAAARMSATRLGHIRTPNGSISMDLGALGSPGRSATSPNYKSSQYATMPVAEDEFGDFATADLAADEFDDFVGASPPTSAKKPQAFTPLNSASFHTPPLIQPASVSTQMPSMYSSVSRLRFKQAYTILRPLLRHIHPSTPPHSLLAILLPTPPPPPQAASPNLKIGLPTLQVQAQLLSIYTRFISSSFKPVPDWEIRSHALRSTIDVFEASLLKSFEDADEQKNQKAMRESAYAAWEVFTAWGAPSRKEVIGKALEIGNGLGSGLSRLIGLGSGKRSEWEVGKVWIERREEFYDQGKWDPLANFTSHNTLLFNPMDSFLLYIITSLTSAASTSNAVFPPPSCVLLLFSERLGSDIISTYVSGLVSRAREVDAEIINSKDGGKSKGIANADEWTTLGSEQGQERYLQAMAASFIMCWKVVDTLMDTSDGTVKREEAELIVYRIFDPHMDEYLDEEVEAVKRSFDHICQEWEKRNHTIDSSQTPSQSNRTRFLTSHNPQQVKRNLVAGFTDVLMLPVTIIPRAVGAVGTVAVGAGTLAVGAARTTGRLAFGAATSTGSLAVGAARSGMAGISMLNPVKWGAKEEPSYAEEGYVSNLTNGDVDGSDYVSAGKEYHAGAWVEEQEEVDWNDEKRYSLPATARSTRHDVPAFDTKSITSTLDDSASGTSKAPSAIATVMGDHALPSLDLFLSLDVALELIHAARDSMKRLESFFPPPPPHGRPSKASIDGKPRKSGPWSAIGFPGPAGRKLRETLEEIFILLLIVLRERHLDPGFERAIEKMRQYKPTDPTPSSQSNGDGGSTSAVAPLLGFFELVHIGDTIGSMIQVYFDRELTPFIDVTDFLSGLMREKKKFENALDEEVAKGLNAGTEVLMTQVEHVLWTRTTGREYCPTEDTVMAELGPTQGCKDVIECLDVHCRVVRGSTSREVLEVFYAEVGMRLHVLIQKHIKRQIVSLEGGIQVIADLNAYYNFVAGLKLPHLLQEFANLKMLGHVFVVADAKDLATIVRDVTRYGGSFKPEDVYEFVQRRSDWKRIEKEVDRTMYNLSFKEDCIIC